MEKSTLLRYLPSELSLELLLYFEYTQLVPLVLEFPELKRQYHSEQFWFRKSVSEGVLAEEFGDETGTPEKRYLKSIAFYTQKVLPDFEKYIRAEECLLRSVKVGNLELVGYFMPRCTDRDLAKAYRLAAGLGYAEILKAIYADLKMSRGVALYPLSKHGHHELLQWLVSQLRKDSKSPNLERDISIDVSVGAARGGHRDLFYSNRVAEICYCYDAALSGNFEFFEEVYTSCPSIYPNRHITVLTCALEGGSVQTLEHLISEPDFRWTELLEAASRQSRVDLMQRAIREGGLLTQREDLIEALSVAIAEGKAESIRFLMPLLAPLSPEETKYVTYSDCSHEVINRDFVDVMLEYKLRDADYMLFDAMCTNNMRLLRYIYNLGLVDAESIRRRFDEDTLLAERWLRLRI